MTKSQYDWNIFKKTLQWKFNIKVRWSTNHLIQFSSPHGIVTMVKEDNLDVESVEANLSKLGLTLTEFDKGYDSVIQGR